MVSIGNVAYVRRGSSLAQADYDGRCALHLAANKGKLLATSYLLSICVRPNLLDRWGTTAVQDALLNNHLHCAKLIKASGGVLGPSATNELKEKYAELDNLDLQETRELVREMQDKVCHGSRPRSVPASSPQMHFHSASVGPCHLALSSCLGFVSPSRQWTELPPLHELCAPQREALANRSYGTGHHRSKARHPIKWHWWKSMDATGLA